MEAIRQKRKRSAVNQFLLYLYQKGELEKFFKLSETVTLPSQEDKLRILDFSSLYEGREGVGKLACLLILELGLLPSEILELDWADIDLDFGVVTVAKGSTKRVLRLEADVKQYLWLLKMSTARACFWVRSILDNGCISKSRLMLVTVAYRM